MIRLKSICRFCLVNVENDDTKILIKIDESHRNKFEELTTINLPLTENFPQNMCSECSNQLENFYSFKHELIQKQSDLEKFLSADRNKLIENDPVIDFVQDVLVENNEFIIPYDSEITEEYVETTMIGNEEDVVMSSNLCVEESENVIETTAVEREELLYEQVKPQLVLTSKFLHARSMIRHPERITSVLESPLIVTNEKLINKCNECSITFFTPEELKLHLVDHKFYPCKVCNEILKTKILFENHMKENHEKAFICATCGNLYYDKISLNSHLRSHNEKSKYKCTYNNCEKTFKHHHHLKNHLRVHDQSSPFLCDQCSASFRQRYALTLHKKKHAGQFFECSSCKSQFLRKSQLEKHHSLCNGTFKAYKTRKIKERKIENI